MEVLYRGREQGVARRLQFDVEIDPLDRAVADIAGEEHGRRRIAQVIAELAELLVPVLPQERLEVDLQRVVEEAVLAAQRVGVDRLGLVGFDSAREREPAGVVACLVAGIDHVARRDVVLRGQPVGELVVLEAENRSRSASAARTVRSATLRNGGSTNSGTGVMGIPREV